MESDINVRESWVDWMRTAACLMVMTIHSVEPFYIGGDGALVLTRTDAFWCAFFDSFVRMCVPLFVIASSYLQFPVRYPTGEFLRRRAERLLVPFVLWSLVYALALGSPVNNLRDLLLNFNYDAGHLWFVYMLIGLYIIMPLLSPWAVKVGKRELQVYIAIWLFTTLIPFFRDWFSGGEMTVISGVSGIPMQAQYPLWGEASWNAFGMFYYISGFVGYMLVGLYIRKFASGWDRTRTLMVAIACCVTGFAITSGGFIRRVLSSSGGFFPISGTETLSVGWETTWNYCSIGVALMAVGWVLVFRNINRTGQFYRKVVLPLSKAGYGMYLCHMLFLAAFSSLFRRVLGIGMDGLIGIWTTPVEILLTVMCSFVCVGSFSVLLQRIPVVGKYIIG